MASKHEDLTQAEEVNDSGQKLSKVTPKDGDSVHFTERNSIVTRSRGATELKPHKPIVVRKQTRKISFNRVNHLFLSYLRAQNG